MTAVYRYRAKVDRVIDGDTFVLVVDLGFFAALTIRARLHNFYAPELHADGGEASRQAAIAAFAGAHEIVVESYKDVRSFERWVTDIYIDGALLAERLIAAGAGKATP